jgi:uncharacterized OB-fold protein
LSPETTEGAVAAPPRKLPLLEPVSAFFWTSGETGTLSIQRCGDCGVYQHPPLVLCAACLSDTVAPAPVSGRGKVKTFTINIEPWLPGLPVPFVYAVVELEEQAGLYLFTNIEAPVDAVFIDQPVEVYFEHHEDVWLPMFRPVEVAA